MDKKLVFLISLFFVVFTVFSFTAVRYKFLVNFIRAKEEISPSPEKSLIIAWPVTVNLKNVKQSKITVFIRNIKESPVSNKLVELKTNFGNITPQQTYTDKFGKAEFIIESNNPGLAEIRAIVDNNIELQQKVNIKFE
jgi:hypothetical protein